MCNLLTTLTTHDSYMFLCFHVIFYVSSSYLLLICITLGDTCRLSVYIRQGQRSRALSARTAVTGSFSEDSGHGLFQRGQRSRALSARTAVTGSFSEDSGHGLFQRSRALSARTAVTGSFSENSGHGLFQRGQRSRALSARTAVTGSLSEDSGHGLFQRGQRSRALSARTAVAGSFPPLSTITDLSNQFQQKRILIPLFRPY